MPTVIRLDRELRERLRDCAKRREHIEKVQLIQDSELFDLWSYLFESFGIKGICCLKSVTEEGDDLVIRATKVSRAKRGETRERKDA